MKLYVANCTHQAQDFVYRIAERKSPVMQRIEIGSQICLPMDLTSIQIDKIVEDHRKYGLLEISDTVDKTKICGLVCSRERPIRAQKIMDMVNHNRLVMFVDGRELRKKAAIAVNNQIEEQIKRKELDGLRSLKLSVVEEDGTGTNAKADGDMLNEEISVERDPFDPNSSTSPPAETNSRRRRGSK